MQPDSNCYTMVHPPVRMTFSECNCMVPFITKDFTGCMENRVDLLADLDLHCFKSGYILIQQDKFILLNSHSTDNN